MSGQFLTMWGEKINRLSFNWIDSLNIKNKTIMKTRRTLIHIKLLYGEGLSIHSRIGKRHN